MKIFAFFQIASSSNALFNEEFVSNCSSQAVYDHDSSEKIDNYYAFNSPWLAVSNPSSPEVNAFYLNKGIMEDMCWALRYSNNQKYQFHSANLGGTSGLFVPAETPSWLSVRCADGNDERCTKFEIQYCCPSELSEDSDVEHAERPFPVFNKTQTGECSSGAEQYVYKSGQRFEETEEFWSHWFPATNPTTEEVNALFFNPGTRRDICHGLRISMASGYSFSSSLMGGDKDEYERYPDWMSVRCADDNCTRFEGQYCCPALAINRFAQFMLLEKYQEKINAVLDQYFGLTFFRSQIGRFTNKWIEEMKKDHSNRLMQGCEYRFDKLDLMNSQLKTLIDSETCDSLGKLYEILIQWSRDNNTGCNDYKQKFQKRVERALSKLSKRSQGRIDC